MLLNIKRKIGIGDHARIPNRTQRNRSQCRQAAACARRNTPSVNSVDVDDNLRPIMSRIDESVAAHIVKIRDRLPLRIRRIECADMIGDRRDRVVHKRNGDAIRIVKPDFAAERKQLHVESIGRRRHAKRKVQ